MNRRAVEQLGTSLIILVVTNLAGASRLVAIDGRHRLDSREVATCPEYVERLPARTQGAAVPPEPAFAVGWVIPLPTPTMTLDEEQCGQLEPSILTTRFTTRRSTHPKRGGVRRGNRPSRGRGGQSVLTSVTYVRRPRSSQMHALVSMPGLAPGCPRCWGKCHARSYPRRRRCAHLLYPCTMLSSSRNRPASKAADPFEAESRRSNWLSRATRSSRRVGSRAAPRGIEPANRAMESAHWISWRRCARRVWREALGRWRECPRRSSSTRERTFHLVGT